MFPKQQGRESSMNAMFGKPTPKGWFETEVRPSYNNQRKLKKILDSMFKENGYKVQAYRDRWIVMTPRRLTEEEIRDINKPREEPMATPKPRVRPSFRTRLDRLFGIGIWKHAAKKSKEAVNEADAGSTTLETTAEAGPSTGAAATGGGSG